MKADEAFSEGGSGDVLAALFVGLLGFERGGFVAGNKMGWVVGVEESLTCGVGVGSEAGVAVAGVVLSVVEDYDSRFCEDGWRSYFGEAAVEVSGAFGEDFCGRAGGVFNGRPVDEVGGGGEVDGSFAPVEPVFAVYLGMRRLGWPEKDWSWVTMPPDLYLRVSYLPLEAPRKAGPCLVQCWRSGEVAMPME